MIRRPGESAGVAHQVEERGGSRLHQAVVQSKGVDDFAPLGTRSIRKITTQNERLFVISMSTLQMNATSLCMREIQIMPSASDFETGPAGNSPADPGFGACLCLAPARHRAESSEGEESCRAWGWDEDGFGVSDRGIVKLFIETCIEYREDHIRIHRS